MVFYVNIQHHQENLLNKITILILAISSAIIFVLALVIGVLLGVFGGIKYRKKHKKKLKDLTMSDTLPSGMPIPALLNSTANHIYDTVDLNDNIKLSENIAYEQVRKITNF